MKILKWSAAIALLFVAILLVYVRLKGLVLMSSREGTVTGYHKQTQRWYLNELPFYEAERDGPYLFHSENSRYTLSVQPDAQGQFAVDRVDVNDMVKVVVDNTAQTQFDVPLRTHYPRSQLRYPQPEKLLAVSDLEGEFDAAVKLFQANGVLDQDLHWSFGSGEMVLLGDLVDRGKNVVPLLWLIYRMEAEAEAAGGRLHYVLGNHEYYLLQGNVKSVAKKYIATLRMSELTHSELWSADTELGRWLRSKPILLQVGDTLFMHGGISDDVLQANIDLKKADQLAAQFFGHDPQQIKNSDAEIALTGMSSILWYRGLAMDIKKMPKVDNAHVERVLKQFDVKRVAIGHSLAAHVGTDYDGRVLRTDVPHADGTNEGILFVDGQWYAVNHEGQQQALGQFVELAE